MNEEDYQSMHLKEGLENFKKLYLKYIFNYKTDWNRAISISKEILRSEKINDIHLMSSIEDANKLIIAIENDQKEQMIKVFENELTHTFENIENKFNFFTMVDLINEYTSPYDDSNLSETEMIKCQQTIQKNIVETLSQYGGKKIDKFIQEKVHRSIIDKYRSDIFNTCGNIEITLDPELMRSVYKYLNNFFNDIVHDYVPQSTHIFLFDTPVDAGWLSTYRFLELSEITKYPHDVSESLKMYERLLCYCQSMHFINGHIIIVEKNKNH